MIGDGGLKAHRSLCAAVSSGVKEFPASGVKLMTGCPRYPGNTLFCLSHKNHVSPALHHKQIQKESLQKLNKDKKNEQHDAELDGVFLVDEVLEKCGDMFHIKWKGYATTTWEPESNIPQFIKDYYIRTGNSRLPKPRIMDSRVVGN